MRTELSPRPIVVLAGLVVATARVDAFLQAPLGGPGTMAFLVRRLLVAPESMGAILLGLAARASPSAIIDADCTPSARANYEGSIRGIVQDRKVPSRGPFLRPSQLQAIMVGDLGRDTSDLGVDSR